MGMPNFTGFWDVIEYWWYTYFRVGKPILKDDTHRFPILDMYISSNWAKDTASDVSASSFVQRFQQMTRSHKNVVFHPYIDVPQYFENDAERGLDYSLRRVVFYTPDLDKGA